LFIIFKFLFNNIKERKLRTVLIIISIAVSSALYFGSNALTTTLELMFEERIKQWVGNADIIIHARWGSPSDFFHTTKLNAFEDRIEYVIGSIFGRAEYTGEDEELELQLRGMDFDEMQIMNPVVIKEQDNLFPFKGKKIIIGEYTAEKYNLEVGESIELVINEARMRFFVSGIVYSTGFFLNEAEEPVAVVPIDTLASIYGVRGRVAIAFVKAKDPETINELIEDISLEFNRYMVREPVSRRTLDQEISNNTTPFKISLILVMLTSVFIIYTSFQVLTRERLPVIGTFRSVGATKLTTSAVLFSESAVYGVIGGISGSFLGIGILYLMAKISMPEWLLAAGFRIEFSYFELFAAFLIGLIICLVSSAIPIFKISKIPIKDIILNLYHNYFTENTRKEIFGAIILISGIIMPYLLPRSLGLVISLLSLVFIITGVVMLIPVITKALVKTLENVYLYIFGNLGVLAAKNIRDDKSVYNNISLLAIALCGIFIINVISDSVIGGILQIHRDKDYEIEFRVWRSDRITESRIRAIEGVEGTLGIYRKHNVKISESEEEIRVIYGVNKRKFLDFWTIRTNDDIEYLVEELDNGRKILLSNTLRFGYDLKKGDIIDLIFDDETNVSRSYEVIGFFDSLDYYGSIAFISERNLKLDAGIDNFSRIMIKTTENVPEVVELLKDAFKNRRPYVETSKEKEEREVKSQEPMLNIMKGFSVIALLISFIGIINNLLISFIERRRSFALMRSVGMNKVMSIKMILIEAVSLGAIGSFIGIVIGIFILSFIIPALMTAMKMPQLVIIYSFWQVFILMFTGILITLFASSSPAMKSSRLNLIQEIRYE
jgi:putative ABC transport system permease protein